MSRVRRWFVVVSAAALALAACHQELVACTSDEDCGENATCLYQFCVATAPAAATSAPQVIVTADRKEAFLGEPVRIDASASGGTGALSFDFRVEPEGTAALDVDGAKATVRLEIAHQDVEVVVAATDGAGATAEARVAIAAKNAMPKVRLEASPEIFQPGEVVTLVATGTDADGDALHWSWFADGTLGVFEAKGNTATLETEVSLGTVSYPVRVTADDGHGGVVEARLVLQPQNAAPMLEVEESAADHRCVGEPLRCSAVVELPIVAEDSGPVTLSMRLLSDRTDVEHSFGQSIQGERTLELSCSPACPLAGEWMIEVTATDALGASSTRQQAVSVRNRPPIVRAHDGSALPHVALPVPAGGGFKAVRPRGAIVVYEDPDGDPLQPDSVLWSTSSSAVSFEDPKELDTAVSAIGTVAELSDLQIAVVGADINGAQASHSAPLPVSNDPPSLVWTGDPRDGHTFLRFEGDGTRVFRKEVSLQNLVTTDPEGDPVAVRLELDGANDDDVVRLISEDGRYFLEGQGATFLGQTYGVTVVASDPWGAEVLASAPVLVSNRPPGIISGGISAYFNSGRACEVVTCCIPDLSGGCLARPSARVATSWGGVSGALVATSTLVMQDPDGDPLELEVSIVNSTDTFAYLLTQNGWSSAGKVACSKTGANWSCPVQVRLEGSAEFMSTGATCAIPQGTAIGASVEVVARAVDGLGGVSAERRWTWTTVDDPADGSCP